MTPAEIQALLHHEGGITTGDAGADVARRTGLLGGVLLTAQHFWYQGLIEVDLIAQGLGDASRDSRWLETFNPW
jgi:hypothetical protein